MTCPKCRSQIDESYTYCNYCGENLKSNLDDHEDQYNYSNKYSNTEKDYKETHDDQYSYNLLYNSMYNKTVSSDEDYLRTFVGENYNSLKNEKFSFPFFLLGPIYLCYKKLWLHAILLLIIYYIIFKYGNSNFTDLLILIIQVYLSFKFNNLYLKHSEKEVEQIKISNPDKTSRELLEVCKEKGKPTNLIIMIIVLFILITSLLTYFFIKIIDEELPKQTNNEMIEVKYEKLEKMNYKVPEHSKTSAYNNDSYHYYSTSLDMNINCSYTLSIDKYTNIYQTADDYIKRNIIIKGNEKVITADTIINQIPWKYVSLSNETRTENYYVTIIDGILYLVEVKGYGESKVSSCKTAENDLVNSIYFDEPK